MRKLITIILVLISGATFAQIPLAGYIKTIGALDTYATHLDSLQKGGFTTTYNYTTRNAIPAARRKIGMTVRYATNVDSVFVLSGGIGNGNWVYNGTAGLYKLNSDTLPQHGYVPQWQLKQNLSLYQPLLGFTPENVANKVSSIDSSAIHYPTTGALKRSILPIFVGANISGNGTVTSPLSVIGTSSMVPYSTALATSGGVYNYLLNYPTLSYLAANYTPTLSGTGYVKFSGTTPSYISTIPNADLTNSAITINGTPISLGGSVTTPSGTVTNGVINWPGTVYSTPTTGTVSSGTLTFAPTLATQSVNTIFSGPSSGGSATPTFRSLVVADIPTSSAFTWSANAAVSTPVFTFTGSAYTGGTGTTTTPFTLYQPTGTTAYTLWNTAGTAGAGWNLPNTFTGDIFNLVVGGTSVSSWNYLGNWTVNKIIANSNITTSGRLQANGSSGGSGGSLLQIGTNTYSVGASLGTTGLDLNIAAHTINSTTSSGTITDGGTSVIGVTTVGATSATTYSTLSSLEILGTPAQGTNVTITNPLAFHVLAGKSQFDGTLQTAVGNGTIIPFTLSQSTLLSSPSNGALENNGTNLYYTNSSNVRSIVALTSNTVDLSSAQTIGGVKTFNNYISLLGQATNGSDGTHGGFSLNVAGDWVFNSYDGSPFILKSGNTGTRTYTTPNVSGTLLPIVASNDLTAQTSTGNIVTYTTTSTATFDIHAYLNVTAVVTDNIQVQVTYTDGNNNAQTINYGAISAVQSSAYQVITIRAKTGTVITVKTNLTIGAGSVTFDAGARITQL